jgi:hypothetical protein
MIRTLLRVPYGLALILLAFLVFLNIHELLHTLAARLLGDPTARYVLFELYQDGYAIGRNYSDDRYLTPLAQIIVSLAGPVGTRLLSELLHPIRRRGWRRPAVFWGALFVCLRLDFIGYVARNFIGDVFYRQPFESQDISEPIHLLAGGDETLRLILWAAFILLAVGDVLIDRRRIIGFFRRPAALPAPTAAGL